MFVAAGHDVVIVDNLSSGTLDNKNEKARFYHEDICEPGLEAIVRDERPDIIDHHAPRSVPASVENPLLDAEVNIKARSVSSNWRDGTVHESSVCVHRWRHIRRGKNSPDAEEYVPGAASPYGHSPR